ncbi:MAG TPA: hypothetical protein VG125_05895, partial [Pirellulales bacterium]|nr:hypothetical protein [Pirellulales bacterium]
NVSTLISDFLTAGAGKSEEAIYLDAMYPNAQGAWPNDGQSMIATANYDFNNVAGTPQLTITKVPDSATVTAGSTIGYTVTIANPGTATATGLTLTDLLPPGGNEFFNWSIDSTKGNPADFAITGSPGSQSLAFSSAFLTSPDSLGPGQSISVHITTPTTVGDVSGGAVGVQSGPSSSAYLGAAGNYGVLYIVGSGTHNLSITNVTIGANVGVGSSVGGNGVGKVTFSGPGIVTGRLDFAPGQTNSFSNNNSGNVGPASVNTNVAAVASAISTVTSLNSSLGALSGTSITVNGTETINESAGTLHTVNGVTYSVFTVTSYNENDGKIFTINGDGSGDPVVLNFGPAIGNVNLGGDVALAGNGLNDDKVIWNFTSSNHNISLNNNASSYFTMAFHGIILAPNDPISLVNANLSGRVFGGDSQDMQLVSGLTLHAPMMNTATVTSGNLTASSSATVTVTGPFKPTAHFNAQLSNQGLAYTPDQIRSAYGVNNLSLDGAGQTIAIVDAYDNPAIIQSLDTFDQQFATTSGSTLFGQYGPASNFLTVVGQNGHASSLPAADTTGGWETEEALDVEWVHAMAPGARIVLVEAKSDSLGDLMSAVKTAAGLPGVSVVSMSWGFAEGQSVLAADEAQYDSYLTTPAGHQGVTFVASTGDYAVADPEYPAFSPNVVAVGGTSLLLSADNSYKGETGWGTLDSSGDLLYGSGGGASLYEPEPAYQQGVQATGNRTTPDVSFVADPTTGVWIADNYNLSANAPWEIVGGTSLSAPAWAALIALADQSRVANGLATLGTAGPTETQQALYSLPNSDYNDVTSGYNGYNARVGYDLVTGLGTPVASLLVPDLAAATSPVDGSRGQPRLTAADATLNLTASGVANAPGAFDALVIGAAPAEHAAAISANIDASVPLRPFGQPAGTSPLLAATDDSNVASTVVSAPSLHRRWVFGDEAAGDSFWQSVSAGETDEPETSLPVEADGLLENILSDVSDDGLFDLRTAVAEKSLAASGQEVAVANVPNPSAGDGDAAQISGARTRDASAAARVELPRAADAVTFGVGASMPAHEEEVMVAVIEGAKAKMAEAAAKAYQAFADGVFSVVDWF